MNAKLDWWKKSRDFFLFSSLFIAVCSVVMCWQTFYLFGLSAQLPFLLFVFFATLSSYNFHWYFTLQEVPGSAKVRWSYHNKTLHLFFFAASSAATIYFLIFLLDVWPWLLATAVFTFLYSAPKIPFVPFIWLRRIALGKTIFLAFAWTHVTAILPLIVAKLPFSTLTEIYAVQQFFLIYPICILFDYRDRHQDIKDGIRSLINQLDEKGIHIVFWGSLLVYLMATALLAVSGWLFWQTFVLLVPGLALSFLYKPAKNKAGDYLFYFILDGLMMLSGLLFILLSFI